MSDNEYTKTNVPGLYKNPATGVIINKNTEQYDLIKAKRMQAKQQNELLKDVENLKSDISEIKNLLIQLVKSK
jgi:hypothetical protein